MTKNGQKVPSGEVILSWTVHSLFLYTGWKHLNEVTSSVHPSLSEQFLLLRPCRKACHETFTPFWEQFLAAPCGFHQIFSILHALMSWNIFQEGVVPLPCEGHVLIHINMIAKSFQDTSRDWPSCNFCHISYQWISPYFCTISPSQLSQQPLLHFHVKDTGISHYRHILNSFPHLVASFNISQIPKTANKLQFFQE